MRVSRRGALILGSGAAAASVLGVSAPVLATPTEVDALIAEFTGGAPIADEGVDLTAPEIAENGNSVPIEVFAEGAEAILIAADGNPNPGIATFTFGALAASSGASTRVRLAQTQNVIAVAKFSDGTFARAVSEVKVTIGGCGG